MSLRTGLVLVLSITSFALIGPAPWNGPPGRANPPSFTLFGGVDSPAGWGFTSGTVASPGPDLTVTAGETVTLALHSADGRTHNWGVDYDNNQAPNSGEPLSSNFDSSGTSFLFTATNNPGTYHYYCFIHLEPMVGSLIVQVPPPDYTISASPSTVGPLGPSAQGTSMITIAPVDGFTSTVDLTTSPSVGLSASVNPTFVSGGSGTSTLTVGAAIAGSYTVTVTGTNGQLSHSAVVTVNVVAPDFSLSVTPTFSVARGSSGSFNLSLQSLGGFSGDVSIAVTVTPAGPSVSASPATVTLMNGGTGSSVVTVSAVGTTYSTVGVGNYTVRVTGTDGSGSHSMDVALVVTSQGGSGVATPLLYVVGSVVAAGIAAVAVYFVRRGRRAKQ